MNNNQNNNVEPNNSSINDIKQNEIINPSDEINSKKSKKKGLFKKTCIILTFIVGIIGYGYGVFNIIQSFFITDGWFGNLRNILSVVLGLWFLLGTTIIIIAIWIIYGIIELISKRK